MDTDRPAEADELERLRAAAVDGDTAALERLLTAVEPLVTRRCARMLPCRQDAEEAAQDAMLAITENLDGYRGTGSFPGWVSTIAANSAWSTYRRLKQRSEAAAETVPERPDPRTTSVIAGSRLDLLEALDELERDHPEQARSFVLRDLAALSYAEIAAREEAPLGTVQARIHRARRFLQPRLTTTD
ncbi:RNA polymerase sigma factor [Microlunatus soli]|uniref:RNA polymerase sigma-70 factor, ECF subfamily n=1 Tax=Microlunatus soli TaxID=630515 RepID=A0A1H1WSI2_9ACTN|nr:RNA polymerase sigma factor [Microlunatus soli]SDS99611.1 RNA polymerase sigma-70 factor, ECF subfamily [Microlunatus soli]